MKEIKLDAIRFATTTHDEHTAVVIPTNLMVRRDGTAVMGAGMALAAARAWPLLERKYGNFLRSQGPLFSQRAKLFSATRKELLLSSILPHAGPRIYCLPTKTNWKQPSDLSLIIKMAQSLVKESQERDIHTIYIPRLGCGLGGLRWEFVKPQLALILDERFTVVGN